jgi:hypothetical protein
MGEMLARGNAHATRGSIAQSVPPVAAPSTWDTQPLTALYLLRAEWAVWISVGQRWWVECADPGGLRSGRRSMSPNGLASKDVHKRRLLMVPLDIKVQETV